MRPLRIAGLIGVLVVSFALSSVGAANYLLATRTGDTAGAVAWNPTGTVYCADTTKVMLESATGGFGPLDSTGTTNLRVTVAGVDYNVYRTGEHDGYTWQWRTGKSGLQYAHASYSGMWSDGFARLRVYCVN